MQNREVSTNSISVIHVSGPNMCFRTIKQMKGCLTLSEVMVVWLSEEYYLSDFLKYLHNTSYNEIAGLGEDRDLLAIIDEGRLL